jgi:hypothetical protein
MSSGEPSEYGGVTTACNWPLSSRHVVSILRCQAPVAGCLLSRARSARLSMTPTVCESILVDSDWSGVTAKVELLLLDWRDHERRRRPARSHAEGNRVQHFSKCTPQTDFKNVRGPGPQAFALMLAHTWTCGSPRKYQTIAGPSICQTSHTPSLPTSWFL